MTGTDAAPPDDRHLAACANTLRWADEAAARGDYGDALEWIAVLEAIGADLPAGYEAERERWRTAAAPSQPGVNGGPA